MEPETHQKLKRLEKLNRGFHYSNILFKDVIPI
jgi:hypothetical protein